ncbi:hypothetical protein T09_280 [Trichinella sp. T9]|nr:hypothetical protein T09_280 [Trichinella sp. T9]
MVLICSLGWLETHSVYQASLKLLESYLPLLPKLTGIRRCGFAEVDLVQWKEVCH